MTPGIEKEPSTLKEAIGTKEPWQMTLEEYAYEEARQRAGKDSLCREIKKRIRMLEIAR